jgi:hypothetical protein
MKRLDGVVRALLTGSVLCVWTTQMVAQTISVQSLAAEPGSEVELAVVFQSGGAEIVATENQIAFDSVNTPVGVKADGTPDCTVHPALDRGGAFAFLPSGCVGTNCADIQALIIDPSNMGPIPDGVLYSCQVAVSLYATEGRYSIVVTDAGASDEEGNMIEVEGRNGEIVVEIAPDASPVPTRTRTPTRGVPTETPHSPEEKTGVAEGGGGSSSGGCTMARVPPVSLGRWLWSCVPIFIWWRSRSKKG